MKVTLLICGLLVEVDTKNKFAGTFFTFFPNITLSPSDPPAHSKTLELYAKSSAALAS